MHTQPDSSGFTSLPFSPQTSTTLCAVIRSLFTHILLCSVFFLRVRLLSADHNSIKRECRSFIPSSDLSMCVCLSLLFPFRRFLLYYTLCITVTVILSCYSTICTLPFAFLPFSVCYQDRRWRRCGCWCSSATLWGSFWWRVGDFSRVMYAARTAEQGIPIAGWLADPFILRNT